MTTVLRPALLLFLLSIWLLPGCRSQNPSAISGHIQNTQDWKPRIYLVMPRHFREIIADYQGQVVDSATIAADGTFNFENTNLPTNRSILLLVIQHPAGRFANHLMDDNPAEANYIPIVFAPGEHIEIEADGDAFQRTCKFSTVSEANQSLISLRNLRIEAFEKYARASSEMENDSLLIEKEKAHLEYIAPLMHFADTTNTPEAALIAIRWISPTNDFERIPEFITNQCGRLESAVHQTPFAADVCAIADPRHLSVRIGDTLPDFPLPMANGDTMGLHSLLSKKLTILDLWASWCAPCRKENRTVLLPLLTQYQEAGLQIIGYSLDAEAGAWKSAIQKDNAAWLHASYLTGDSSPFMDALRVSTIPANYILDSHGKVLAKNLHGAALEKWIMNAFEKEGE